MKVLLSKPAQEKLQESEIRSQVSLQNLVSRLESLNPDRLEYDSSVRRVSGATEEIYVLRIKHLRVFFTKKGEDLVLLSIEDG